LEQQRHQGGGLPAETRDELLDGARLFAEHGQIGGFGRRSRRAGAAMSWSLHGQRNVVPGSPSDNPPPAGELSRVGERTPARWVSCATAARREPSARAGPARSAAPRRGSAA